MIFVLLLAFAMNGFPQSREVPPGPDVEVLFRFVQLEGAKIQVIITRPRAAGRYPAVLLIGGLGCYSLDRLKPGEPYYELLYGFIIVEESPKGIKLLSLASDFALQLVAQFGRLTPTAGFRHRGD